MSQKKFAITLFVIFFLIGMLPIFLMIYESFLDLPKQNIFTTSVIKSFENSLLLSFIVAFLTTIFGTILGLVFSKTDFKYSNIFLFLFIIPLLLPSFIIALGWIDAIGVNGIMSEFLFGFWGTSLVLFSVYLPIPLLLSIFFLKQINPKFEEAARLFTSNFGVLKEIVLPMMKPSLMLSFLLVFILSFGEYSVANVLRYDVFALESFTQFSAFYDFKAALLLAIPMLLVVLLVIFIEQFYIKKHSFKYKTFDKTYAIKLTKSMEFKIIFSFGLLALITTILPLSNIFLQVGDFQNLQKAFEPLTRSILYSFVGATILMIFGFLYGYIIESKEIFSKFLDVGIIFLFALPATVFGISLVLFYNRSFTEFIYTTPIIVIFSYFGKYLALTTKIAQTKLSTLPTSMSEAAQMAGANWYQTLFYIILPLSKKTLISMFLVGFIFSFREINLTMLLYPAGYETLPVYILTQMANGKPETIASLCAIMVIAMLLPLLALMSVGRSYDRI